jgi:hypothetical protein
MQHRLMGTGYFYRFIIRKSRVRVTGWNVGSFHAAGELSRFSTTADRRHPVTRSVPCDSHAGTAAEWAIRRIFRRGSHLHAR